MACSRVFWNDNPDKVVGRTLDWPPARRLPVVYAFRASHARRRDAKPGKLGFKIQHRVMGVFDKGATEGIYDRGLAAHLLYLDDAKFETRDAKRSGVGFWLWAQYYLDNFKTVREALAGQKQVQIVKTRLWSLPGRHACAPCLIEFVDGHAVVHMGERYQLRHDHRASRWHPSNRALRARPHML